ncbi:MAG: amidohydrolase [Brumimicrobium sp.]|nr:amidohydrolase [Brumimicrobium sp.]
MEELTEIRHYLHAHPEVSGKEKNTSKYIREKLVESGVEKIHTEFSQNSLIAEINGKSKGATILFRCELDALPIKEEIELSYKSDNKGVSHKCGHDGHMAIMLGLTNNLLSETPEKGTFLLLFQSAEETGEGAKSILDSGYLDRFEIDYAISLHNVPGYPKNSIICRKNVFTPTVESLSIELTGETSHAGEPDKGKNPAMAVAEIIRFFEQLHQPNMNLPNYFVVAPVQIIMGEEAYGISAGSATVRYTIRGTDIDFFKTQKDRIISEINKIADNENLESSIEWLESFSSNKNDPQVVDRIKRACAELGMKYIDKESPFDWGEDFGLFTQKYKGAMFGLGSGEETPPLHDSRYDFPDEIISHGQNLFFQLAKNLQNDI